MNYTKLYEDYLDDTYVYISILEMQIANSGFVTRMLLKRELRIQIRIAQDLEWRIENTKW